MKKYDFKDLCEITDKLLGRDGCPWDRAQTHESLKICLLEECYEVLDAIDKKDNEALAEELGDVLLQVVFHGKLAENEEIFNVFDITDGICKKLISRHPHIFASPETVRELYESPENINAKSVLNNWEEIKRKEKGIKSSSESMRLVPKNLPQLVRAEKIIKKAEKTGMPTSSVQQSVSAIIGLLTDFETKNDEKSNVIGNVLFEIANISAKSQINAEFSLTNAIETFINRHERFEGMCDPPR